MKRSCILIAASLVVFAAHTTDLFSCTTAIVSGKCTPDGRPILFKNRDTGSTQNRLVYVTGEAYDYIGVVDASDTLATHIWQGVNSAGFAVMNSLSYNINFGDTTRVRDKDNGTFMKIALESCATLADFERLLDTSPKPLGVEANFGVIDAHGGAAYYETGHYGYTKMDANDPSVAPYGYIIRTNYSFTGPIDKGHGYIRFKTAEQLIYEAVATNGVTPRFFLRDVSRSLSHSLTGADLSFDPPENADRKHFVHFEDYIPRFTTASSTVVHGVKQGEPSELTTMWTILGFPLSSVAVPVWVAAGEKLPETAGTDPETGRSPLCMLSFELKKRCFPVERGSGSKYLDLAYVINREGTGTMQLLKPVEEDILRETGERLDRWRDKGFSKKDAEKLYGRIDKRVYGAWKDMFGIDYGDLRRDFMRREETGGN